MCIYLNKEGINGQLCVNEVIDILTKNKFLSYSFTLCDVFSLILYLSVLLCISKPFCVTAEYQGTLQERNLPFLQFPSGPEILHGNLWPKF